MIAHTGNLLDLPRGLPFARTATNRDGPDKTLRDCRHSQPGLEVSAVFDQESFRQTTVGEE